MASAREDEALAAPPATQISAPPRRARSGVSAEQTASDAPAKSTKRGVVTKFLAGGGTVLHPFLIQRPASAAPSFVVEVSSSEGEGPTLLDKDDSMYHGKAANNRVGAAASSSIIRTRAAARASASVSSVPPPASASVVASRPARSGGSRPASVKADKSSKARVRVEDSAVDGGDIGVDVAVSISVPDLEEVAPSPPVASSAPKRGGGSSNARKAVKSSVYVEDSDSGEPTADQRSVPDLVEVDPFSPVASSTPKRGGGTSKARKAVKSPVYVEDSDSGEPAADHRIPPESRTTRGTAASVPISGRNRASKNRASSSVVYVEDVDVRRSGGEECVPPPSTQPRSSARATSARDVQASTSAAVSVSRTKNGVVADGSRRGAAATVRSRGQLLNPALMSPPVTPTPVRNKRSSSSDLAPSEDDSDVPLQRRAKRVRTALFTPPLPLEVDSGPVRSEGDGHMEVDDEPPSDVQPVDEPFDIEGTPSDSDRDVGGGESELSASPDDNISFAKAMGLPEPLEESALDIDADEADGSHKFGLVLDDLHFYCVRALPSRCEVTDVALQDAVLKKYYVKSLPHLRHGVLTSWSGQQGDGMVWFSDWGTKIPNMKFKTCINIIEFRASGRYMNPCRVSPLDYLVKYVPAASQKYQLHLKDRRHAICLSAEWERFVGFICSVFDILELDAQIWQEAIQFSTRPSGSYGSGNDKTQSSPSIKVRASRSGQGSSDPYSLAASDEVPVYDCRSRIVDFNTDLDNLSSFPLWRQEIPSGSFIVVAHTVSVYKTGNGDWSLSLNVLWVMLVGSPVRSVYRVSRTSDAD
ncbi:hypothetical protein MD484_g6606, partial [Candolleomyces efflorescens]